MKRILLSMVSALAAFTTQALADDVFHVFNDGQFIQKVDGIWYQFNPVNMHAGVTCHWHHGYDNEPLRDGGEDYEGDMVIPNNVNGYTVTCILENSFKGSILNSLTIPNTVKYISSYAFQSTKIASQFNIPASVDSLVNYALWLMDVKKIVFEDGDGTLFVGSSHTDGMFNYDNMTVEEIYLGRNIRKDKWAGVFSSNNTLKRLATGNKVTAVQARFFSDCPLLESVTLGSGITAIEEDAFSKCPQLKNINLPEGLIEIGHNAFLQDTELTTIELPSTLKVIDTWAFQGSGLTEIIIPASVTTIGEYSLSTKSLTKVTIENSTEPLTVGSNKTYNGIFSDDIQSITEAYIGRKLVPDQTKNGRQQFFGNNPTLKKVTFGPTVKEITDSYFKGCTALETVVLPNTITTIGDNAFEGCNALSALHFPASVTTIGNRTFLNCKGLTNVRLNEGLTEILAGGFYGCSNLESISLPSTLTVIGNDGFYSCTALKSIYCYATTPPTCGNANIFHYLDTKECTLYVPEPSINAYKQADVWKDFFNIESSISSQTALQTVATQYTLGGQQLLSPRKGLTILRYRDGRTRKVIVK